MSGESQNQTLPQQQPEITSGGEPEPEVDGQGSSPTHAYKKMFKNAVNKNKVIHKIQASFSRLRIQIEQQQQQKYFIGLAAAAAFAKQGINLLSLSKELFHLAQTRAS